DSHLVFRRFSGLATDAWPAVGKRRPSPASPLFRARRTRIVIDDSGNETRRLADGSAFSQVGGLRLGGGTYTARHGLQEHEIGGSAGSTVLCRRKAVAINRIQLGAQSGQGLFRLAECSGHGWQRRAVWTSVAGPKREQLRGAVGELRAARQC